MRWRHEQAEMYRAALRTFATTEQRLAEWRSALARLEAAEGPALIALLNAERNSGD